MPELTLTQHLILQFASERDDGGLLPLNKVITVRGAARTAALAGLVARGYAAEQPTTNKKRLWREDGDTRYTLVITPNGRRALDSRSTKPGEHRKLPPLDRLGEAGDSKPARQRRKPKPQSKPESKLDRILRLLRRQNGATIQDLQKATGWQSHSVRAALTGLRKKGHEIVRTKNDGGATRYRISETRLAG